MTKAIRFYEPGGPEVLCWEDVELCGPGKGEMLVRHEAVGLNYIDVYHRKGLYPLASLPSGIGLEGAGTVESVGEGVSEFKPGDRVAYASPPVGAYAEARVIAADRIIKLPEGIAVDTAAAMMLKGMTAQYLLRRTFRVKAGDTILFHAAAGGVGLIACQWAKALGATVIGTVGTDQKAEIARAHGCDYPIVYTRDNFTDRVRKITDGKGVAVVYDSVGKDTFESSIDCLKRFGMMVSYGNASGPIPAVDPLVLSQKGSLYLTRPTLMDYTALRNDLIASAYELFDMVRSETVKIEIKQRYALSEAAQAHRDLEARKTSGSTVLLP